EIVRAAPDVVQAAQRDERGEPGVGQGAARDIRGVQRRQAGTDAAEAGGREGARDVQRPGDRHRAGRVDLQAAHAGRGEVQRVGGGDVEAGVGVADEAVGRRADG